MPLSATVKINGRPLETVWIARTEPLVGMDEEHQYVVALGNLPPWENAAGEGLKGLPTFRHRYSDGALVCVQKAIARLAEGDDRGGK